MKLCVLQGDAGTAGDLGDLSLTRECTFTINVDHARATQPGAASEFRARELELFANNPKERRFGRRVATHHLAIDAKLGSHLLHPPCAIGTSADLAT